MRRNATTAAAVLTVTFLGACPLAGAQQSRAGGQDDDATGSDRPNILLVITDDIGLDVTTGMFPGLIDELVRQYGPEGHGHPDYLSIRGEAASTPNIDRLARQGMAFSNVWAQPFCSPTRASILTGLSASKAHVLTYADPLSQNHASFVSLLSDAGYSTALFGKWHLAGLPGDPIDYPGMKPKEAGFELFKGNLHAAIRTYWDYDYQVQDESTPPDEWREDAAPERSLPGIAPTTYAPVVKVADTIDWITRQEASSPDQPWFAWLAFNLSHATIIQQPSAMAVPNADTLNAASRDEMKACGGTFGSSDVGSCSGEALMRAMTSSLDTVLGKLLDALENLDPNTYVIIVGDNGTPMYARPNLDFIDNMYITRSGRGKGTGYESGVRVAMVIRGPRVESGTRIDEPVQVADLFSTILSLAKLDVPATVPDSEGTGTMPLDAVSLAPILFGDATAVRDPNEDYLLAETLNLLTGGTAHVGVRNRRYKLVCTGDAAACELYDLIADPLEEYPLARPDSCESAAAAWTPADPEWHDCRLRRVVESRPFL